MTAPAISTGAPRSCAMLDPARQPSTATIACTKVSKQSTAAASAARCSNGKIIHHEGAWRPLSLVFESRPGQPARGFRRARHAVRRSANQATTRQAAHSAAAPAPTRCSPPVKPTGSDGAPVTAP